MEVTNEPIERGELAAMLAKLALHDRGRADWSRDQWAMLMGDYLDELVHYPAHQVEMGCQVWRREGKPFFPTIAEFISAMKMGTRQWMYD